MTNEMTVDREGFISILADIWPSWTTAESIQRAAKVVGVSIDGLNVEWMNQEKMDKAEMLIAADDIPATPSRSSANDTVESQTPEGLRRNSNVYLKFKLQKSEDRNEILEKKLAAKNEVNLNEIPGFLEPKKVRPKKKKSVEITQVHGSLAASEILEKLEELEKAKDEAVKLKEMKAQSQIELKKKFEECKNVCVCDGECSMKDFKQCPVCFSVKKSVCSKKACMQEDGSKPVMIRVNMPSTSKAKHGAEFRKRKREWDDSDNDSDGSMFDGWWEESDQGLPKFRRPSSDIDDSLNSSDDDDMQLLDGVDPPLEVVKISDVIEDEVDEGSEDFSEGMHVIIEYEGELFPGKITEVVEEGVKVSCMEKSSSVGSTWKWPAKMDEHVYPFCDVRFKNVSLNQLPGTARKVEFHVVELDNVWGDINVYM